MKNEIKVRRFWGSLNPTSRIHADGKQSRKPKFSKNDRRNWKKDLSY
jgi:hypothetical protein